MILITVLTGPFAGRTREMPNGMDPADIYWNLVRHGWDWQTDYSQAAEEEKLGWFRVEMMARIVRTLQGGLSVRFLDQEWRVGPDDDLIKIGQEIEDAIVASGRLVTITSDDDQGLVIGIGGYEQ